MNKSLQLNPFRQNRDSSGPFSLVGYVLVIIYAMVILVPLYFALVSAFKENTAIFSTPLSLPKSFNMGRFLQAQANVNLFRAIGISFLVTTGAELLTLVLAFPAAYSLARIKSRLTPLVESIFGLGFLIPPLAILMPIYLMTASIGRLNDPLVLIVFYPALKLPLSIILLASFMRKLPFELEESAEMDGANVFQIMGYIFLPLSVPGIVTVLVLNFIDFWNEYLFALILMSSDNRTIQVAISLLRSQRTIDYGLMAAGVVISMIPVYIVFIFFQERIMQGLTAGAIKE
jgi:multiple sugar transport system permease protein